MNCIEVIEEAEKGFKHGSSRKFRRRCWADNKYFGGRYLWFNINGTFMWQDASICHFRAKDFSYNDWEIIDEETNSTNL